MAPTKTQGQTQNQNQNQIQGRLPAGYEVIRTLVLEDNALTYVRMVATKPVPELVHVVRLKLEPGQLRLAISPEGARGQTPSKMAQAQKTLVSMNGSFFDPNMKPLGLVMQDGRPWQGTRDTSGYFVFACTAVGACSIESKRGIFDGSLPTGKASLALSGRPLLIIEGKARTAQDDQTCPQFCARRHPRTGIGLDSQAQELLLVLVEGRQPQASGATLAEFAALMADLGAHSAINLDGGGSASLVLGGERVSGRPVGETEERPVANVLSILAAAEAANKSPAAPSHPSAAPQTPPAKPRP